MRHALASAALGTALTLGALNVPAAAAPATTATGAVSTQASEDSSWSPASVPASWRPFERYYWYLECLAAGVANTVGPSGWAIDYDCRVDTSNSNHYRLWLYY
ncbi:hypothetical protein [Streptomyces sp. NPDC057238]|uniref:hypothetical protein n=1 Tax=Streptomyces sp. NPDC057238 TaxID=3346060 RepID=UPI003631BEBB